MRWIPLLVLILPVPVLAKSDGTLSWGKPGVSLDQYTKDAQACADTSRTVAVHLKPETLRQLDALSSAQLLDVAMGVGGSGDANPLNSISGVTSGHSENEIARRSVNFGETYVTVASDDVRDELQAVLDKCLGERGYVRIRLTPAQANHLAKLKRHSAERIAYLHAIDTDPEVIARQRLDLG